MKIDMITNLSVPSQSNGAPFFVETPSNTIVLVSDWDRIKEINAAPEGTLSLLAAAKDLLQPKNTMSGFDWNVTRGSDGAPLQMTLRSRLVGYLPVLLPDIRRDLAAFIDQRIGSLPTMKCKQSSDGIRRELILVVLKPLATLP